MFAPPAAVKRISKAPARLNVTPLPLTELCHDALAKGVLEKHEGLPPSWLALFKAHPDAWQQLTDAVLATEKGPLGPHSTIMFTVVYEIPGTGNSNGLDCETDFYTILVPLTALPHWFAILLNAYIESVHATPGASLEPDCNFGYQIKIGEMNNVSNLWEAINDIYRVDRILNTTRLELFDAFKLNVREELHYMIADQAAAGTPITDDDDDMAILEMFDESALAILRDYIDENASNMDGDWFQGLKSRQEASSQRALCKAPHVSLMVEAYGDVFDEDRE
jgi:hypothetical protein